MARNEKNSDGELVDGELADGELVDATSMNRQQLESVIAKACSREGKSHHSFEVFETWPREGGQPDNAEPRPSNGFFIATRKVVQQIESSPSVAIISSRLPKVLDGHGNWFDALRTIGVKLRQNDELLVTAEGTTAHRYCLRIAELFSIRQLIIKIVMADKFDESFVRSELLTKEDVRPDGNFIYAVADKAIKADQILAMVADSVYGLSLSRKGNAAAALSNRLSNRGTQPDRNPCTFILHDDSLTAEKTRCHLIDQGAIDWLLLPSRASENSEPNTAFNTSDKSSPTAGVRSLTKIDESEYLIHWTRARSGPWPEQSETDHLDDLIFGSTRSKHSEIFSLSRILASQRIIAAGDLTRDHTPVVCFSEVAPSELRKRTVYRKHLQRWDFLPYGIAIKRSVLESIFGCKPVIYGDDETWKGLPDHQKPLFQTATSSGGKTDWREEKEWRVIGDVNLKKLAHDDAFVFTGQEKELEKLAQMSLFDLIVI